MLRDLVINLPKDHLKHMKIFLGQHLHYSQDIDRVILLVSPELQIDKKRLVRDLIKAIGFIVITRRCIMDRYEKHDSYVPGCIPPEIMSEVTKMLTLKDPVPLTGWLMFDHPCSVREARCLQQDGVLPTVTLLLTRPPAAAPPVHDPRTPARSFFQQDIEGLKFVYKSTLKEVYIESEDDHEKISAKCCNAIRACAAGAQGPGQGLQAVGAPGVYRVILIGPRSSGRRTQGKMAAKHFGLVYLHFNDLYNEAKARKDDVGHKIRNVGVSVQLRAEIVRRRILQKDCIERGWVLIGYPATGTDFELLDLMHTPPNRIIFLNVTRKVCKERATIRGVDWCTGQEMPLGSTPRVMPRAEDLAPLDAELETYFTESLAELRAAAGITAVEIDGNLPNDQVFVKVQAAIMAAPAYNIESCFQLRNVRGD
ncbi:adenylate kinase 8 isoform X2 [Leptidea sinapis]|nr:adenylate kinase 8 isoform X2 [Leptidea sinapis]